MTTVTIDITSAQTIADTVAALPSSTRDQISRALRDAESVSNSSLILASIRETLAEEAPGKTAVGVRFLTMEYDNGHYLHENGTVLYDDGTTEETDLNVGDQLTDEYGRVGPSHSLVIDLRTDEFTEDEYGDDEDLHALLGVAKPPAEVSPADRALLGSILFGDRDAGLGRYRVARFTTVTSDSAEHRIAVLESDTAHALHFACLTCSLTGFANDTDAPNPDTSDAAVRRWHR